VIEYNPNKISLIRMHHFPHIFGAMGYVTYLSHISYLGIFLAILSSGHLIPIPEGVTLIVLGYLSKTGARDIYGVLSVAVFSVMFFDMFLYVVSLGGSRLAKQLEKKVKVHILERYADATDNKLLFLILTSHFVPGWRFANPIIAGVAKIPWRKFLLFTFLSSLVYAPVYVGIGYIFHYRIQFLLRFLSTFNKTIIPVVVILALIGLLIYLVLERRKSVYNKRHAQK